MKCYFLPVTALLLTGLAAPAALAATAETSKAQLQKDATHVVVGSVQAIVFSTARVGRYDYTHYVAKLAIDRVEKGIGLNPGNILLARYWSKMWIAGGPPPPDYSGHWPRPKSGEQGL